MIRFTLDIISELGKAGYNTNRIRQEKLISEATLQNMRKRKPVSWATIDTICRLLNCQPGDILEYVADTGTKKEPGA